MNKLQQAPTNILSRGIQTGSLLILMLIVLPPTTFAQSDYVYKIVATNCISAPKSRALTGFRVRGVKGLITALHGVVDCSDIRAIGKFGAFRILGNLKIKKADLARDTALLTPHDDESLPSDGFEVAQNVSWNSQADVHVIGFPIGVTGDLSTPLTLRTPPLAALRDFVPAPIAMALLQRRSPDPDLEFVMTVGSLLPGHSGAPILDGQNRVLAVGNGGLLVGSDIGWAIPWSKINLTDAESIPGLNSLARSSSATLFAMEEVSEAQAHSIVLKLEKIIVLDNGLGDKADWTFRVYVDDQLVLSEPRRTYKLVKSDKQKEYDGSVKSLIPIPLTKGSFLLKVIGSRHKGSEAVEYTAPISIEGHNENPWPVRASLLPKNNIGRGSFEIILVINRVN